METLTQQQQLHRVTTPLNEDEDALISTVKSDLAIPEEAWTSIDDDLFFPKDKVYKEGDELGIGRCVGTVQTSPEKVRRRARRAPGAKRRSTPRSSLRSLVCSLSVLLSFPAYPDNPNRYLLGATMLGRNKI